MSFSEIFGGSVIYPSEPTYLALALSANVTLQWPIEQQIGGSNIVADIIDVDASAPGLNIDLSDARQVSTGFTALFNNVGGQTVTIRDSAGGTIVSLAAGSAWQIYLRNNSTAAGLWRTFQYGASVSVANAAALAGAGLKAIAATLNTRIPVSTKNANYIVVDSDRAVCLMWTGGVGTYTLPNAGTVGSDWYFIVRNSGSGNLTVSPPSGTIDGAASLTVPAGGSCFVVCDGANYFSVGFGSGSGSGGGFNFIEIDVSGAGNYVLSGVELNKVGYRFIGVLTGTRNIVVPGSTQEYWVTNSTTGAFSLFVKTLAQVPGIEVLQNNSNIMYCDGTNVIDAESSTVSFPIPVAQGGTGATTASNARTNLAVPGLGTTNQYTVSPQSLSAADPSWRLNETDAAADNRLWGLRANGEQLLLQAIDDAIAVFTTALAIDRTGTVIDQIALLATTIALTGNLTVSGTASSGGNLLGYLDVPQNSQSGNYTTVLADRGKDIFHPSGAGAGDTFTIAANASVAYPIGSVILFTNMDSNVLSIAINGGDTLRWAGVGSTGTRSLSQYGWATARKVGTTEWLIGGIGLT